MLECNTVHHHSHTAKLNHLSEPPEQIAASWQFLICVGLQSVTSSSSSGTVEKIIAWTFNLYDHHWLYLACREYMHAVAAAICRVKLTLSGYMTLGAGWLMDWVRVNYEREGNVGIRWHVIMISAVLYHETDHRCVCVCTWNECNGLWTLWARASMHLRNQLKGAVCFHLVNIV